MVKTYSTRHVGVRYKESKQRMHNGRPDRCYLIRYSIPSKRGLGEDRIEELVGWASEGVTPVMAAQIRSELVRNTKQGTPPFTLRDKRRMAQQQSMETDEQRRAREIDAQTFDQLAQRFLTWGREKKKSWRDDENRYYLHVQPVIGHIKAVAVSVLDIETLEAAARKKGVSPKTLEHILGLVRSIYRKSRSWGLYRGAIPTDQIQFPRYDNMRTRFLTYEEADILLLALFASSQTVYLQALLSLYAGLRFGEIAALTWGALDFGAGVLHIYDPKGVDTRVAFMTPRIRQSLEEIRPRRVWPDHLVFPKTRGDGVGRQHHVSRSYYQIVDRLFNRGVTDRRQKVTFHTLRHTFCSWLAMNGASPFEIMQLAGHKDLTMTQRYAHVADSAKKDAVHRLAQAFDDQRRQDTLIDRIGLIR